MEHSITVLYERDKSKTHWSAETIGMSKCHLGAPSLKILTKFVNNVLNSQGFKVEKVIRERSDVRRERWIPLDQKRI